MIHNTLAVYRVPFFVELGKLCDLTVMFYDLDANHKIYNDKDRTQELVQQGIKVYTSVEKEVLKQAYRGVFDFILLPAMDDFNALKINYKFLIHHKTPIGIWWGKWIGKQAPIFSKRYLKDLIQKLSAYPVLRLVDRCFAYGSKAKEYIMSCGVPESRISVFINSTQVMQSPETIDLREKYNIGSDKKIILYLGRLIKRKGVQLLIDAFNELESSDFQLLLCGVGADLEELKRANHNSSITFAGYIAPDIRSEYYKQSNFFVLPSYFDNGVAEPWGLTVNEALQFHIPVLATTAVGAAFDLIENGKNGIIVQENDISALVRGIRETSKLSSRNISECLYTPATTAKTVYEGMQGLK